MIFVPSRGGIDAIGMEMLGEIGVAKLDYDKRPDEVLYGLEIRVLKKPLLSWCYQRFRV